MPIMSDEMPNRYPLLKHIVAISAILPLLSWNVEAYFANNHSLIKWINSRNLTWKAGVVVPKDIPDLVSKKKRPMTEGPRMKPRRVRTPGHFDSREHWSNCRHIIDRINTQGGCGSCWAIAVASVLSDRTCIETRASTRVHLSAEDLLSCCSYCWTEVGKMCEGGEIYNATDYWIKYGIVTGGGFNSNEGCKPYSNALHKNKDVPCVRRCTNQGYRKNYDNDIHKGKSGYYLHPKEKYIMREIFTHGPVVAVLYVYADFIHYAKGVYRYAYGKYVDAHAVRIVGWGEESGVKYWLVANSWGPTWALNGYFKIVRGENHCMIEQWVLAGRLSGVSPASVTLRETDFNCASDRSLFLVEKLLLYAFCTWVLKEAS